MVHFDPLSPGAFIWLGSDFFAQSLFKLIGRGKLYPSSFFVVVVLVVVTIVRK